LTLVVWLGVRACPRAVRLRPRPAGPCRQAGAWPL